MSRWDEIEDAYHSARDLKGDARTAFLNERVGADSTARRNIEALLACDGTQETMLDRPALHFASELPPPTRTAMPLIGHRIGAYQVLESIGSGGMGDVYRARDTILNRDVALKVLRPLVVLDRDRPDRLRREATVLASVNHPNIAAIYGLENSDGVQAIALELIEGPTLADLIAHGPIPLDDALLIARQIAEALEAAHEQGVVHSDLKPANIKVRSDGLVKVLDFGLAKGAAATALVDVEPSRSPTLHGATTNQTGSLIGTAAYMSPEQANGQPVDKRSDVWAFGCVLYEMLTGKRAFTSDDVSGVVRSVVHESPDWTAWPDTVPSHIRELVEECLQKDRRKRIADISTVRFVIKERRAAEMIIMPPPLPRRLWKLAAIVAATAVAAGALRWGVNQSENSPSSGIMRFSIPIADDQHFEGRPALTISPDGTQVVYAANHLLYLRSMSELEGRPIAGTEGVPVTSPAFSPDGRSIAFFSGSDRTLKRVAIGGGIPMTIASSVGPLGLSWNADGLVFGQGELGIMRVPAEGGTPEVLVAVKRGEAASGPQLLPDGRGVLFTLTSGAFFDKPRLVVQTSASEPPKTLIDSAGDGRYLPTGHIVYAVEGTLWAVSFDLRRLQVTSTPVPIVEGVARTALTATGRMTGMAQWSVSTAGSLVYVPGPASDVSFRYVLALLDPAGRTKRLPLQPDAYESPRFSPDGQQIAFARNDGKNIDVWIYDLAGSTPARRLTFGGRNRLPTWSPDGRDVAFQSDREGDHAIFRQRADSSGTPERLTKPDAGASHIPESWSRSGVLSFSVEKDSRFSLWMLTIADKRTTPFGVESEIPAASAFSPDGRWVAYQSGKKAGADVRPTSFVQPFPANGSIYEIPHSGAGPSWSADGKKLFYTATPRQWVTARVTLRPGFVSRNLVNMPSGEMQVWRPDWWRQHDVGRDGSRIGMIPSDQSLIPGNARQIQVILNWFDDLKRRVPVKESAASAAP